MGQLTALVRSNDSSYLPGAPSIALGPSSVNADLAGKSETAQQIMMAASEGSSDVAEQSVTRPESINGGIERQFMALAASNFAAEPSAVNSIVSSSLAGAPADQTASQSFGPASFSTRSGNGPGGLGDSDSSLRSSQQGQNILVQVQAMDTQSFMDHSQEIAQAVRQAMLNLNSLNDVILDL
jgi:hypothetical protein